MLALSGVFMLMTLVIFVIYGIFASRVRSYVAQSPQLILRLQRTFAMIFASLAVKLATAEQ